jgi:hypothetical protein
MRQAPQYRIHSSKNLGYVLLGGRMIYLGRAHSPESRERYHAVLAAHYAGEPVARRGGGSRRPAAMTVAELAERWIVAMREQFGPTHQKAYEAVHTGRDLARLQAALLLDQGAGYSFGRVDTKTNVIADGISRMPCETSLAHEFPLLLTQAPSLLGCRRFRPNADLISSIVDALLRTGCLDPLTASKQLLIDPGRFTTSPGAMT